jgi:hypothetical protein
MPEHSVPLIATLATGATLTAGTTFATGATLTRNTCAIILKYRSNNLNIPICISNGTTFAANATIPATATI